MNLTALAQRQLYSLYPAWGTTNQAPYLVTAHRQWKVSAHTRVPWWVLQASDHPALCSGYLTSSGRLFTEAEYDALSSAPSDLLNAYRATETFEALFTELRRADRVTVAPPPHLSAAASATIRAWYGVPGSPDRLMLEFRSADTGCQLRLWQVQSVGLTERRQRARLLHLDWAGACQALMNDPSRTVAAAVLPHTGRTVKLTRRMFTGNPGGYGPLLSQMLAAHLSVHPDQPGTFLNTWFTREILAGAGLTAPHHHAPRWLLFQLGS